MEVFNGMYWINEEIISLISYENRTLKFHLQLLHKYIQYSMNKYFNNIKKKVQPEEKILDKVHSI